MNGLGFFSFTWSDSSFDCVHTDAFTLSIIAVVPKFDQNFPLAFCRNYSFPAQTNIISVSIAIVENRR